MENFELVQETKRIADSLESIANFTKCYGRLIDAMGVSNEKTVVYVKKTIDKAIEEFDREEEDKPSYFELEYKVENLERKIKRLEEELESAYADFDDEEDD